MTASILAVLACAPDLAPDLNHRPERSGRPADVAVGAAMAGGGGSSLVSGATIRIDSDDARNGADRGVEASTAWWTSSSTPGAWGGSYLVAPTESISDPAAFWFELAAGGCYEVAAWWTDGDNRSASATFIATNPGGAELGRATVDQRVDGSQWNALGSWDFEPGVNRVLLSRWAPSGSYVVADALRLTPCSSGGSGGTAPAPSGVDLAVPYFYQYDNAYEPSATCGVTSTAMALNYWSPGSVTPDSLYLEYGKAQAQSPSGVAALARAEGLYAESTATGTRAGIKSHLDAGRPVVAHGFWTSAGHIVTIVGYDDDDWIVNDPAGDWYTCYGCGWADHARYPMGGAWDDDLSWDGDIWYSVSDTSAF